ncbi:sphingolipid transporter [Acrasis kona]|uniref:Sphingolipid transporter n=1 Tax=Acrasis kona TaxID=1008807 RepID=A0AAW2YYF6_9EUKA
MVRYIDVFWKRPKLVLVAMAFINLIMYFDRGILASVLSKLLREWKLSKTMGGILQSSFIVGFMIASPLWANLTTRFRVNTLISIGMYCFSIIAILLGVIGLTSPREENSWGYYVFTCLRFLIGIAEASFVPLSISIIDDISPIQHKSTYMSVFLITSPMGIALGYAVTGLFDKVTGYWQLVFFCESLLLFIMATLMIFIPLHDHVCNKQQLGPVVEQVTTAAVDSAFMGDEELDKDVTKQNFNKNDDDGEEPNSPASDNHVTYNVATVLVPLVKNFTYVCIVAGSTQYYGVLGALVFWAPTYINYRLEAYDMQQDNRDLVANLGFSAIIIVCSIFGSIIGGVLLDLSGGPAGYKGVSKALFWCCGYLFIALPVGLCVFLIEPINLFVFFLLFGSSIFLLMLLSSPFQCAVVCCLPENLRHFGSGYQIFFLHALGDFPSPFLFGVIADKSLKYAMLYQWHF